MTSSNKRICSCKKMEFCDICLTRALDDLVKRGILKRVTKDGEHAWVDVDKPKRLDPEPKGISWST